MRRLQLVAVAMIAAGAGLACSLANAEAVGMVFGVLAGWPAALLRQEEGRG